MGLWPGSVTSGLYSRASAASCLRMVLLTSRTEPRCQSQLGIARIGLMTGAPKSPRASRRIR